MLVAIIGLLGLFGYWVIGLLVCWGIGLVGYLVIGVFAGLLDDSFIWLLGYLVFGYWVAGSCIGICIWHNTIWHMSMAWEAAHLVLLRA